MALWFDYMNLWQTSTLKLLGAQSEPVAEPAKGDKRFKHEDWQEHALFDYIKQSYLIAARWLQKAVADVEGLTPESQKKGGVFHASVHRRDGAFEFCADQPLRSFARRSRRGGGNLVKGLHNLLDDIERGNGQLKISMTDPKAFELGVNIATTPGKVVFQNELMQLIQYVPATPKVAKRPLLIIPRGSTSTTSSTCARRTRSSNGWSTRASRCS
jgi:polyhydroxyalkanoate synthase